MKQRQGITLVELIVVIGFLGIISASIIAVFLQAARIFRNSADRSAAQTKQVTTFRRIDRDFHEAVAYTYHTNWWITLVPPLKGPAPDYINQLEEDTTTKTLKVKPDNAHAVHYFLGKPNVIAPSDNTGTVLYRAVAAKDATAFTAAEVVLDNLDYAKTTNSKLFALSGNLVYFTLNIPVTDYTPQGRQCTSNLVSSKFLIRSQAVLSGGQQ